jgi:hypothetical protein
MVRLPAIARTSATTSAAMRNRNTIARSAVRSNTTGVFVLRPDSLERPDQWLGDRVEAIDERLLRVRAEQLQPEADEQHDLEDREQKRDDPRDGPHRRV